MEKRKEAEVGRMVCLNLSSGMRGKMMVITKYAVANLKGHQTARFVQNPLAGEVNSKNLRLAEFILPSCILVKPRTKRFSIATTATTVLSRILEWGGGGG